MFKKKQKIQEKLKQISYGSFGLNCSSILKLYTMEMEKKPKKAKHNILPIGVYNERHCQTLALCASVLWTNQPPTAPVCVPSTPLALPTFVSMGPTPVLE